MAFLFGKKKGQQPNALPPATREIGSSHGQQSSIPVANGIAQPREPEKPRVAQNQTPTPSESVNNSQNSFQAPATAPDAKPPSRAEGELPSARNAVGPSRPSGDSPYPWSQRRLAFPNGNPFPRYGPAVNAASAKDGTIYIMGGLINGTTVKGDLWMVEAGNPNMACYPVNSTGDGPGPRVGHAALLVGNAFIVFGGDTKMDEGDFLDDTLYLLNTSTKHWSRAMPTGPRPSGRYGHSLNLLGSKIFIFGGQVEGFFFNDLVAFDLNSLQSSASGWEVLIPNSGDAGANDIVSPPARTNHTVITFGDKLYLFGGTDGITWFNDVWTYDSRTNAWSELDCIGYIPTAREGHAAALVNDTMYVFGGRTKEGNDLGDLAAFRIPSRRWYMFQNMGPSPSPRSGHSMTAFGRHIVVVSGEPSSSPSNREELSASYVLDTSKIRYPVSDSTPPPGATATASSDRAVGARKVSLGEKSGIPTKGSVTAARESVATAPGPAAPRAEGMPPPGGSRLPRAAAGQAPSGPPPQQQPPRPNGAGPGPQPPNGRSKTPTRNENTYGADGVRNPSLDRVAESGSSASATGRREQSPSSRTRQGSLPKAGSAQKDSMDAVRSTNSRSDSRSHRTQASVDSSDRGTPRPSIEQAVIGKEYANEPIDSGVSSSPAQAQQKDELVREMDALKSRNAWYASELALARKAGYNANTASSPVIEERGADAFGDEDRPLVEALLRMKFELKRVQETIDDQAKAAASKIAEVEKQRDVAVNEAVYAKAKLAAHGGSGSQAGTPQLDNTRGVSTPDNDRVNEINRRLAGSLASQTELASRIEALTAQVEAERRAKQLAEETAEAAQVRVSELDLYRQRHASEVETLRAELHESQRIAREEAATAAEAQATSRLLSVDKQEIEMKLSKALGDTKNHSTILLSLRDGMTASTDKAMIFERKFEEERRQRTAMEQELAKFKAQHESQARDLEAAASRYRDAEELAAKHAAEAESHRQAVLSGLGRSLDRDDDDDLAVDERVTILQQQVEAATALSRNNQQAADLASDKLRRAEERIAGLEAYQEQTSRESLTIRKQLQVTMKESQSLQRERDELLAEFEKQRLETNALEIQLKTLRGLLDERGVNASEASRRSRALDSPNSRFGTPDLNRVRELEQQLDASIKAHEELRSTFEEQQSAVNKEWEGRVARLSEDHHAAVEYLKGTEKMLTKMKQELDRYKAVNNRLEKELADARSRGSPSGAPAEWEVQRSNMQKEISTLQESLRTNMNALEAQLASVESQLTQARREKEAVSSQVASLESASAQARGDLDTMRRENALLEERAREAEQRVQMFLDQFENSVDNYRRQSMLGAAAPAEATNRPRQHNSHDSMTGDSIYSNDDDADSTGKAPGAAHAADARNSMALDNLANELDALRSRWETTSKDYRLSDRFDFEKTPTHENNHDFASSLGQWQSNRDVGDVGAAGTSIHTAPAAASKANGV